MVSKNDLLAEVEKLKEENRVLRNEVNPVVIRLPENTETYNNLSAGKIPVFKEVKTLSYLQPQQPNISLVEGDNLAFLVAAQVELENKVDVAYLDPPYNTGKDIYTYKDNTGANKKDKHSLWVSSIERRLKLVRPLLRSTGVIMCAIGVDEVARLRIVMDEVFGEGNFVTMVTWSGSFINNAPFVSASSDYMLIYAKDLASLKEAHPKWRTNKKHAEWLLEEANNIWLSCGKDAQEATKQLRKFYLSEDAKKVFIIEPGLKMYNSFDSQGRLYRASDLSSPNGVGQTYKVVNPHTNEVVANPKRGWVHSERTFQRYVEDDRILWNGAGVPAFKRFLKDNMKVVLKDLIVQDREPANKLLARQVGRNKFSYPKDHNVLAEWFDYVTPAFRKEDTKDPFLLLDIYAGSGSSALAIAQLNMLDGGCRESILVTVNESEICEKVTAVRLKNLLTGRWASGEQMTPMLGSLKFYKTFFVTPRSQVLKNNDEDIVSYFMNPRRYEKYIKPIVASVFV